MLLVICVLEGLCYLFLCGMRAFRICVLCVSAGAEDMVCVLLCRLGEGGETYAFCKCLCLCGGGISGVVCWRNNL